MLDILIQSAVEFGVDKSIDAGVMAYQSVVEEAVASGERDKARTIVRSLTRGILEGQPRSELTRQAAAAGLGPAASRKLVDRLLKSCQRTVEMRFFWLAVAMAGMVWIAPLLFVVSLTTLSLIAPSEADGGRSNSTVTALFVPMGILVAIGFYGAKVIFPKWFATHVALAKNDAAQRERLATARLATWLGPVGGHYWYLGHMGHWSRTSRSRILGSILLAGTGAPALISWTTAWRLWRMSDYEFETWVAGVDRVDSTNELWSWLAALARRSSLAAKGALVAMICLAALLALVGVILFLAGGMIIAFDGDRFFLRGAALSLASCVMIAAAAFCWTRAISQSRALRHNALPGKKPPPGAGA